MVWGTKCSMDAPCVKGARCLSPGRGMVVAVDPGSPTSSGAVLRMRLVVGCIPLYWIF